MFYFAWIQEQQHGQYEQQVLLKADNQRELLDRYAGHTQLVEEIRACAQQWKTIQTETGSRKSLAFDARCWFAIGVVDGRPVLTDFSGCIDYLEYEQRIKR